MHTILLIEDHEEMRENIAEILGLAGYKVLSASHGKQGVRLAQEHIPDLIICDIMMPELDGYGVLHMLSRSQATAGIPFIFLTAKSEKSDFRKGMSLGADDYLTKPFDDTELLNVVETRLRKSKLLRETGSQATEKPAESLKQLIDLARARDELVKLNTQGKSRSFKKKQVIYTEGSFPVGMFLIEKGKVKTVQVHDDGKELITGLYKQGDYLGYRALLEQAPYHDTAITLEPAELMLIPKDDFFALLHSNRDVSAHFIKLLCHSVAETEQQLLDMAYNSVRKRIANALIQMRNRYKKDGQEPFSMPMPREDLAGMAGTATETVIRTLSDFRSEKLIDIRASNITILEPGKLEKMVN